MKKLAIRWQIAELENIRSTPRRICFSFRYPQANQTHFEVGKKMRQTLSHSIDRPLINHV